jgi:hypothetical protein
MTHSFIPAPPAATEAYPGEQLALLRKVSAQLDQLHAELDAFRPLLEKFRGGGLLGAARAARPATPRRGVRI